ncbi:PREDICTED: toll/interleukin-1 receptor-like protein [Camelina sativa]|uniref:ADP-ribosyl cyclase/cyclic ADP-ribose hydrolase n=1 Tax=Camelina sativa TaxID=90675 RepID=A0ABM0V6D0_CAMSA|nr:PREDICTED: toll/interleukin-1 receptor-like protein [Camelina sativa]
MKFDVFVSFRGIDTRRTFVSHLCHSLYKRGITVFKNDEERPENELASSQVLQSIEESRAAIVIISKIFASSVSCLDELVKIMECREKRSQGSTASLFFVVPVFYSIDPCDVVRQADNLMELVGGDNNLDKLEKWRDALRKFTRTFDHFFDWEQDDSCIIDRAINYISQHLSAH